MIEEADANNDKVMYIGDCFFIDSNNQRKIFFYPDLEYMLIFIPLYIT